MLYVGFRTLIISLLFVAGSRIEAAPRCANLFSLGEAYQKQQDLLESMARLEHDLPQIRPPVETSFDREDLPILHALEKEGLYYHEIAKWFPNLRDSGKTKLVQRLDAEVKQALPPVLTNWLSRLQLSDQRVSEAPLVWEWYSPQKKLQYLLDREDLFRGLNENDQNFLFEKRILDFNDLDRTESTPKSITVGDDAGSYEVRSTTGVADRVEFYKARQEVETYLAGKIGHQHFFHGWPKDRETRELMAPYYVELLDASTWYLFWRQMKRNPEHVSSILTHPFLGVYTRHSLESRHQNLVENDARRFRDKYRMVGARSFPALESQQQGQNPNEKQFVTDWELRSGNKAASRPMIESAIEARLVTGDYSGIRDFRSYQFDPSAPISEIAGSFLKDPSDVATLEKFELLHPKMKYSGRANAKNHTRNRILSPLLPWQNRLSLGYKVQILTDAQRSYARGLLKVAERYNRVASKADVSREKMTAARQEAVDRLEILIYEFSLKVRLDMDFERYLSPNPTHFPSLQVASSGPVDINRLALGIEYSLRFPWEYRPQSKKEAQHQISEFAQSYANKMGWQSPQSMEQDSHGHGVSVKYTVAKEKDYVWRFEWDGIQRTYEDGKITNAFGGHTEVVTPKFVPEDIQQEVAPLYRVGRLQGMAPSRRAGGAHVNFDLAPLKALGGKEGPQRVLNLISYFESNIDVILHMWQAPSRRHAAYPVILPADFAERLAGFSGGWKQLGLFLYQNRYFNTFVGRKPKYVPLNLQALMTSIVPNEYLDRTLDIKNEKQKWFPNFNRVFSRGEARFFDAPTNEYMAALQIKYMRALLNKAFNSPTKIQFHRVYSEADRHKWESDAGLWLQVAEQHLRDLGLDPSEFRPLLWESFNIQRQLKERKRDYQIYQDFLPPKVSSFERRPTISQVAA